MLPVIVNTEDKQLSTPIINRLCQDEKCQSTRCYKKMSPVRPKYKYDENCQSGSSSEKKSSDPEGIESNCPKSPEDTNLDMTSE